jgi:hypothetical protein
LLVLLLRTDEAELNNLRIRKSVAVALVAALCGLSMLIATGRFFERRHDRRLRLEHQSALSQNQAVLAIQARLEGNSGVTLADALQAPTQQAAGSLTVYDNSGALLTKADPGSLPEATAETMVTALQSGRDSIQFDSADGTDWFVRAVPIRSSRAVDGVAGVAVFKTNASAAIGSMEAVWNRMLLRAFAAVGLAALIVLGLAGRFAPRLLTRGKWALLRECAPHSTSRRPGTAQAHGTSPKAPTVASQHPFQRQASQ